MNFATDESVHFPTIRTRNWIQRLRANGRGWGRIEVGGVWYVGARIGNSGLVLAQQVREPSCPSLAVNEAEAELVLTGANPGGMYCDAVQLRRRARRAEECVLVRGVPLDPLLLLDVLPSSGAVWVGASTTKMFLREAGMPDKELVGRFSLFSGYRGDGWFSALAPRMVAPLNRTSYPEIVE